MRVIGRLAESEDPVLFARFDEVDKCEFIKANAPEEAWEAWTSSDDDGAGLLVKAKALREQAREVLVSAARCIEPPHSRSQPCGPSLTSAPPSPPLALLRGRRCGLRRRKSLRQRGLRPRSRRRTRVAAASRPPCPTNLLLTYYMLT